MENEQHNQGFEAQAPFSPLEDNVIQREYTKPNVKISDFSPIEEPTFATPSFEELDNTFRQQLGEDDPSGSADPRQVFGREEEVSSANPYTENLDKKDQRQASKAMVDAILDGYGQLKKFSNTLLMISPSKVKKLIAEGEIDANTMIPMGNTMIPLMDYIETYNQEVSDTIGMSDEFKEKVTPVLLWVLMKRNIGMTDEQLLAYYAVSDLVTTSVQIYGIRSQNNQILEQLKAMKQSNAFASQPSPNEPKPKRTPKREPEPQIEEEDVEEYQPKASREFSEPEEVTSSKRDNFTQVEVLDDLQPEPPRARKTKSRVVKTTPMPEFGDAELLSHMESIAQQGAGSRKRPKK